MVVLRGWNLSSTRSLTATAALPKPPKADAVRFRDTRVDLVAAQWTGVLLVANRLSRATPDPRLQPSPSASAPCPTTHVESASDKGRYRDDHAESQASLKRPMSRRVRGAAQE